MDDITHGERRWGAVFKNREVMQRIMLLMGGGKMEEVNSTIQKAAETGGTGGVRLICNA